MGRRPKPQPKKPARPILPMLKKKRGRPRKILGEEKTTIEAKIEALLKRGRERGFVTYTEILGSFPNIEVLQFSSIRYELDAYRGNLSNLNNQYFFQKQGSVMVDQSFYKDCEKAIRGFLTIPTNLAKIKANPYNSLEQAIYHAFPGYLEELAMLLTLPRWRRLGNNEQYPVCEIYPGKSEVQDKLQRGAYNLYELCKYLIINPKYMYMEAYYEPPNS